jgi:hypothetical protein
LAKALRQSPHLFDCGVAGQYLMHIEEGS